MKMIIEYAGKTYESKESEEAILDALYDDFENANKLKMELTNGSWLILGRDAVRSCAITIIETAK